MHKDNKPPSVHVLGNFNFGFIVWPDRLNKSGSPLSPSEGEILIITSLPGQFADIHSPDRLNDHDIVSGTLKVVIPPPPLKNLRGRCIDIRKVIMNL